MNRPAKVVHLLLLLALCYVLFFHHLGRRDLWSSHEARAAQDGASVLHDGQWIVPRLLDGRYELQKPPLYYWLVASCSWLTGEVDANTARLPAAAAAAFTVLLLYVTLSYLGRPHLGVLAAVIIATCDRFSWLGRVGRIDMPLAASVTAALVGFYLSYCAFASGCRRKGLIFAFVGYIAVAAGVLLKGPLGLILPGCVGVGMALSKISVTWLSAQCVEKRQGSWKPLLATLAWGVPLIAALVVPWYMAADSVTHGEFSREFLWRHNLQRGLGGDDQLDGHDHPAWFYAEQLGLDAMPWTLVVLPVLIWCLRRRALPLDDLGWFGLIWFLSIFVFLSAMRYKRPDYLLPAYGGLALFLASLLSAWFKSVSSASQQRSRMALSVGLGLWLAGWIGYIDVYLPRQESKRSLVAFATEVRRLAAGRPVILFRVDCHQLAWHLGSPQTRVWEWENLDIWAAADEPRYIIMPSLWAAECERRLEASRLTRLLTTDETTNGTAHEVPLVLLTSQPGSAGRKQ